MMNYIWMHVLVRHEQGATHAAQGYARATGKVGVAIATSGPGATNLVTGIADAQIDSTPMVCITGQVGKHLLGSDAFQETDIGISTPVTKWNYQITEASEIPEIWQKLLHCTIRTSRARFSGYHKMRNLMNLSSVIKNAQILEVIIQNQL
jgi:thiamine pyrophosphate-dependent acetolactate synthase large subunit-like protein